MAVNGAAAADREWPPGGGESRVRALKDEAATFAASVKFVLLVFAHLLWPDEKVRAGARFQLAATSIKQVSQASPLHWCKLANEQRQTGRRACEHAPLEQKVALWPPAASTAPQWTGGCLSCLPPPKLRGLTLTAT